MDNNFIPVADFVEPPKEARPYKLTVFRIDGSQETLTIKGPVQIADTVLAVKVEIPDFQSQLWAEFREKSGYQSNGWKLGAAEAFDFLAEKGLLKCDPASEQKDWLEKELDLIGRTCQVPRGYRQDIKWWFHNPDKSPEVPFDIKNQILTVKPVGHAGRVVCLPTGHTVAYSYARALYRILCGEEPYDYHVNQKRIKVREYLGHKRWSDVRTQPWSMSNGIMRLGCQRIPARAIIQLARREGWDGEIIAKYL